MAILSWVSQRALWLRRISSMPVSTGVGARTVGRRLPVWGHGQRGSLAHAEKNLGRGRFSKFSRSTKFA